MFAKSQNCVQDLSTPTFGLMSPITMRIPSIPPVPLPTPSELAAADEWGADLDSERKSDSARSRQSPASASRRVGVLRRPSSSGEAKTQAQTQAPAGGIAPLTRTGSTPTPKGGSPAAGTPSPGTPAALTRSLTDTAAAGVGTGSVIIVSDGKTTPRDTGKETPRDKDTLTGRQSPAQPSTTTIAAPSAQPTQPAAPGASEDDDEITKAMQSAFIRAVSSADDKKKESDSTSPSAAVAVTTTSGRERGKSTTTGTALSPKSPQADLPPKIVQKKLLPRSSSSSSGGPAPTQPEEQVSPSRSVSGITTFLEQV